MGRPVAPYVTVWPGERTLPADLQLTAAGVSYKDAAARDLDPPGHRRRAPDEHAGPLRLPHLPFIVAHEAVRELRRTTVEALTAATP